MTPGVSRYMNKQIHKATKKLSQNTSKIERMENDTGRKEVKGCKRAMQFDNNVPETFFYIFLHKHEYTNVTRNLNT